MRSVSLESLNTERIRRKTNLMAPKTEAGGTSGLSYQYLHSLKNQMDYFKYVKKKMSYTKLK